jgi:F-type H+-transporting ATPase subunit delta
MKGSLLAVRYAKSLLGFALEQGELERVYQDIRLILNTCNENKELRVVMNSPIIGTEKKKEILESLFGKHISKITLGYFSLLASKHREGYIIPICEQFIEQYKKHKHILTAVITTATGLDEEVRGLVKKLISDSFKTDIDLQEVVDPKIIGGFVLRVGDKQDDTSIARKIRLLTRTFSENPYIKEY